MRCPIFAFIVLLVWTTSGLGAPAIVYMGQKQDGAYNQSLHQGIKKFQEKHGIQCVEIETPSDGSRYLQTVQQCIANNHSPVILPYMTHLSKLPPIILQNKQTDFILLSLGEVDLPNAWSFSFANEEGGFLAGALASLMSTTKTIGLIYTSNLYTPLLDFRDGYIQGARFVNPDITIVEGQLGNKDGDWRDTQKAQKLAARLIAQGADVLFPVAGYAGTGVLEQAAKSGVYAIGIDINQNHFYPGTMIGSMVKRSDKAVFIALALTSAKIRRDGVKKLRLIQSVMTIDFDGVESGLVPKSVQKHIEKLKTDIIRGRIKIIKKQTTRDNGA